MSGVSWPGLTLAVLASAAAAAPTTSGCGGEPEEPPAMQFGFDGLRETPRNLAEIDFGDFSIVRRMPTGPQLFVKFHLHLLVEPARQAKIEAALEHQQQRVRDQVLEVTNRLELDHFHEPTLRALKSDLLRRIQRTAGSPNIHEVVFSDYSTVVK